MNGKTGTERLRDDMRDYFGTAMFNGNPMAMMELEEAERASANELRDLARRHGVDTSPYEDAFPSPTFTHDARAGESGRMQRSTSHSISASVHTETITPAATKFFDEKQQRSAMSHPFNSQADEMLNEAMDELQDQLDSAEAKFESDGRYLEITSKYANCNDLSVLGDILAESRRITDELYASYEALIRAANSICKPFADQGVKPASLKRVVDFMKHINAECSTLGSNFTASVNDYSLGSIGSTRYAPTAEARMIETNWKLLHSMHPQVAEEKRAAEEAAAKARALREERERLERKKAEAEYPRKLAEWEAECKRVQDARERLLPKARQRAEENLRREIDGKLERTVREAEAEIAAQQAIVDEAQATIKAAKFLEFGKKLEANNRSTAALASIANIRTRIAKAHEEHADEMRRFPTRLERAIKQAEEQVEKKNPLPRKPRDPNASGPFDAPAGATAVQVANAGVKEAIWNTLREHGAPMCITEIMEYCDEAADLSNQRVSALVRQLVTDGLVERTEVKRMAYFEAVE